MLATDIRVDEREGRWCLSGLVRFDTLDRPAFRLEWSLAGGDASWFRVTGDAFLAALLLPAMRLGENLTIDAPVSDQLLANVGTISDIYAAWVAGTRRIRITCPAAPASPPPPESVGLFFACGVDSFYSLLKDIETPAQAAPITHLILIYGFDVRMGNRPLFDMIADRARRVAAESGRSLLTVETNARQVFDAVVGWDFYHGAVLASTALALGGSLRRCTIPSTHAYSELLPWGSDPMLDPLWSTESLEIVHDGCEARRTDKVKRLAQWPLVLQHLRVCWPDWTQDYNCGRCEKCIRTMIGLHLAGVLDRSATFPQRLDPKDIRSIRLLTGASSLAFMVELLSVLRDRPADRHIAQALAHVVRTERMRMRMGRMLTAFPALHAALQPARAMLARHYASKSSRSPVAVTR